jgi:hypothetical protein
VAQAIANSLYNHDNPDTKVVPINTYIAELSLLDIKQCFVDYEDDAVSGSDSDPEIDAIE